MKYDTQPDNIIRQEINAELSFLDSRPSLHYDIMSQIKGEKVVNKKVSLALVFVLILLLTGTVAVAAVLLSGKDFVDQFLGPMSQQTENAQWTDEELDRILSLSEDNGIEITEDIRATLKSSDPVYKEELLRLFMKIDLGFYPATWPLEEQAWYNELLVQYGIAEKQTRILPAEGEISQEDALNIARKYILDKWNVDVLQGEYTFYQQYMLSEDDETGAVTKIWDIEYESEDGTFYVVCLQPDGAVIEDEFNTYIHSPEANPGKVDSIVPDDIWDLAERMQDDSFYTVETLAHFRSDYGSLIEAADNSKDASVVVMRLLLEIPYAEPKVKEITPGRAFALAKNAAVAEGWTNDWLGRCRYSVSYRDYEDSETVYRICFKLKQDQRDLFYDRQMPFGIVIYIDPENGDVISINVLNELDEYDSYCEFPDPHDRYDSLGNG